MATPKTPISPTSPRKGKKDSSFLEYITLGRKKKNKEAEELDKDMKDFLDETESGVRCYIPDLNDLEEGEERLIVEKGHQNPSVQELIKVLVDWINDELVSYRIIVRNLQEDLYDGQVLQKLVERLSNIRFEFPEVLQSETGQKQKLRIVLEECNRILGLDQHYESPLWTVEKVHGRDIIAVLHLLTALVRHYRPPVKLPENVRIEGHIYKKQNGELLREISPVAEQLTMEKEDTTANYERDAFDTLFDHAPEKLEVVKKSLIVFVNKHMTKVNIPVQSIEEDFHDGVVLVMLMGLLGGYFVPLHNFHLKSQTYEEKVANVTLAYKLMMDAGLQKPKPRPEDIVKKDMKSTMRVLFCLLNRFKNIN